MGDVAERDLRRSIVEDAMGDLAMVLDDRAAAVEDVDDPALLSSFEVGLAAGLTTAARLARQWLNPPVRGRG